MSWSTASRPDGLEQPVVGTSGATDSPEPSFPAVPETQPASPGDDPEVMREAWRVLSVVGHGLTGLAIYSILVFTFAAT